MKNVPLFDLNYGNEEIAALKEVVESKWISMGEKTNELEQQFSRFIGTDYGVALNSCTAALHLAMRILNMGPGDEVILPSLTFVATANAILYVGAKPVFADVTSLDDWTLSTDDVARKITPKTKAVIVMHYAGFGCDMEAIKDLAVQNNLYIVEDASHAPGGTRDGKSMGTYGDFSCYSFYSNKNMTTAEGGILLTQNEEYAQKARILRSHGMTTTAYERDRGAEFYDVVDIGYNYRLDNLRSALGLVQLKKLPKDTQKRNQVAGKYKELLSSIPEITIPFANYDGISTYYIFPVFLKNGNRTRVRKILNERGVQTSMHYPPVHLFGYYKDYKTALPLTEEIGEKALSLPIYSSMTEDQVLYVCETLQEVINA